MRTYFNVLLFFTLLICGFTLALSSQLGLFQDLFVFLGMALLWLGLLIGIGIAVMILFIHLQEQPLRPLLIRLSIILVILGTSIGLLKFYVPIRIGFLASRPAFDRWLAQNPNPANRSLKTQLGWYEVNHYAVDPRGGHYFRVHQGGDGLGPDIMSYGFVYRPNSEGTPFGAAEYRGYHLDGDWYWFHASDDW